jgi:hypothetical protein
MRHFGPFPIALTALVLAACGGDASERNEPLPAIPDPLVARTLNDPLMVDPDLAYRNEANAALAIRHDHALPPMVATTETAQAARDMARGELLDGGPIADLPLPVAGTAGAALALGMSANDIIAASGAPSGCKGKLEEGLVWAARMPDPARVMPHGMAMQAAGTDGTGCNLRIVRYVTAARIEEALAYHFNRASRAGMTARRFKEPEDMLDAARGAEHMKVYARPGPGGTSAIDIVYWKR